MVYGPSLSQEKEITPFISHLDEQSPVGFLHRLQIFSRGVTSEINKHQEYKKIKPELSRLDEELKSAVEMGRFIQDETDKGESSSHIASKTQEEILKALDQGNSLTVPAGYHKGAHTIRCY